MRILGIDPGYAIVGYGVIDYVGVKVSLVDYGAITTAEDMPFERRLAAIYDDMRVLLNTYKPQEMGIEKLFFNTNQKTGIDVAQARGVTLLPVIQAGVPFYEYTPLQVKSSIVGYGRVSSISCMGNPIVPKPDDAADALALAITHAYSINSRKLLGGK